MTSDEFRDNNFSPLPATILPLVLYLLSFILSRKYETQGGGVKSALEKETEPTINQLQHINYLHSRGTLQH